MNEAIQYYMDQHFPGAVSYGIRRGGIEVLGLSDREAMRNHVEYL